MDIKEIAKKLAGFRYAIVRSGNWSEVAAYLPMGYKVQCQTEVDGDKCTVIAGLDNAGWTMDGYVIPRLGSGMLHADEIGAERFFDIINEDTLNADSI